MSTGWTVRSAQQNNGIKQIHLTHDNYRDATSQPSEVIINAVNQILPETFMQGDVWAIEFKLIHRSGQNGP